MLAQILIVMIAAIAVTIVAERRNIQPPLLLAAVGLAASFLPGLGRLELDPEIILTVVLPPLLYSAAQEFSFVSFLRRLGSIINLGVFMIAATTGVVGAVAFGVVPGLTIAAALALGAVVSPPDAVTAVAVGRQLGLPSRLMTVLKGESLINDAAALTLFTFATASVVGTRLFIPNIFLYLLYAAVVGVLVGVAMGAIVHRTRLRLHNASLATVLSVVVPFAAYLIAEQLGASGVLAVVAAGFSLGHNSSEAGYESRIQERQFWRTADALLEAFVFAYIGLQLRFEIEDVTDTGLPAVQFAWIAGTILVTVIAVRIGWVFATAQVAWFRAWLRAEREKRPPKVRRRPETARQRLRRQRRGEFEHAPFHWRENLVIGWTGMRGVVTLAAAAGVPLTTVTGEPFPGRDVLQAVAFVVTIGTLLIQGLTLPLLIRVLRIGDPDEAAVRHRQHEVAETVAREASRVAVTAFRDRQTEAAPRRLAEMMLQRLGTDGNERVIIEGDEHVLLELTQAILAARRAAVVKARDERRLDDEVMREVLQQMDLEQAMMANWSPGRLGGGE